ncbi:hypothetical protein [Halomarina litorea]|uniref:hypothetical protein n=1 Tax=Halomarina litorea TaxID=2961595 RepID=UPI0020C1D13C|nr:hypothetical protein [Halomarina sp. BCD28]
MAHLQPIERLRGAATTIDRRLGSLEEYYATGALRYSLAVVFFWFGIIKPLGVTPATMLVSETLEATPILRALISFPVFMSALGWWEAIVGLGLLHYRTVKPAVACMMVQMAATFVPLFVVPEITFQSSLFVPTTPGLYIVKNFVLLTAGLVVASSYGDSDWRARDVSGISTASWSGRAIERWRAALATIQRSSLPLLRTGLVLVFLWSGLLTILGRAEPGDWMAAAVAVFVSPGLLEPLIGALELAIGLYLVTDRTTHIAAYLVVVYLFLSLLPIVALPAVVFQAFPVGLSFEGAYLVKDWVLVSAVIVVDYHATDG